MCNLWPKQPAKQCVNDKQCHTCTYNREPVMLLFSLCAIRQNRYTTFREEKVRRVGKNLDDKRETIFKLIACHHNRGL